MSQQIIDTGAAANDGTGEPLRTAFNAVNNNFTEIYTSGPVGSNVVISGNTITVLGANNNLVLAGNGIGNIQANSSIMPSIDGVYDVGAPSQRIDTVYAQYFVGNGSQLTGITTAGTSLNWGTSNVKIVSSGGNVTVSVGGTSNIAVFSTGGANVQGNITSTGNITGGNVLGGANVNATTHTGTTVSVTGTITGGNLAVGSGTISTSGNITGGNVTVGTGTVRLGNIVNANGNATGNIGNASGYFNTLFATSTTATHADLAEWYAADAYYEPGTVLVFGGDQEVTLAIGINDVRVAGVVSTTPAHVMNAGIDAKYATQMALSGRVPTLVVGAVAKGDMMVSAGGGRAKACAEPRLGSVIGKALQDHAGGQGTIEIVVGRV